MRQLSLAAAAVGAIMLQPPLNGQCTQTTGQDDLELADVFPWIPDDTETLIVAGAAFRIGHSDADIAASLRTIPWQLTSDAMSEALFDAMQGHKVRFSVAAGRQFSFTHKIGVMDFEGCQILCFDASAHGVMESAIAECKAIADGEEVVNGERPVRIFFKELPNGNTVFVASPRKGILAWSNNRPIMRDIVIRSSRQNRVADMAEAWPAWNHIDKSAPVWGIRRFPASRADHDITSPLNHEPLSCIHDNLAIGVTFCATGNPVGRMSVSFVSSSGDLERNIVATWRVAEDDFFPDIHMREPGVVEVTMVAMKVDRKVRLFQFLLMWRLGYGLIA